MSVASSTETIRASAVQSEAAAGAKNKTNPDVGAGGRCVICADQASDKVVKDANFVLMMELYWRGMRVDVKPEVTKEVGLCYECFDSVLQFYQINDVLIYFESRLKQLQRGILTKNLKGIQTCQEKGVGLSKVQRDILEGTG
jgi:hypothetical protein